MSVNYRGLTRAPLQRLGRPLAIAGIAGLLVAFSGGAISAEPAKAKGDTAVANAEKPRTLTDYVELEKPFYKYLMDNHPIFKIYQKEGRLKGKVAISDRQEEFIEFGGAMNYLKKSGTDLKNAAITYRLPAESFIDQPNKFVGPKKCGECHPAQYEKWERSRHSKTVRFPHEVTEVKDLTKPVYDTSPSAILPPGITPDQVYAIIGTPRTKYGFVDAWLVRGTYHIRDGQLKDGTGTLVAGGNQFSRQWAQGLTPEVAKKVAEWIPGFPTKLEDFGKQQSKQWGTNSYGSSWEDKLMFQPGSSYCEVCHSWKLNFPDQKSLMAALGDAKALQAATVAKGISCEECHGAGAHLVGGNNRNPGNCERCHQRFAWEEQQAKANPKKPFGSYFKSRLPSCGTEGSQLFNTKHKDSGMRCSTCHDPHEVTENDWKSNWTKPALKKNCEECHATQGEFFKNRDIHAQSTCTSCHMPVMMSCENFGSIQYSDQAGFDTSRSAHIWKINVAEDYKTINPPAGKSRDWKDGPWQLAKDKDGRPGLDAMWTCARTSWSDGHLNQSGGCHSPIVSELPGEYQFRSQKEVVQRINRWQTPVKQGMVEAKAGIENARKALAKSTAAVSVKAQAQSMINQAQAIVDAVAKDGSHGAHAPNYTKQKVDEAKLLAAGAADMATGKPAKAAKVVAAK